MRCPSGCGKLYCYDSRPYGTDTMQRRYRCLTCDGLFTTREEFKPWIYKREPKTKTSSINEKSTHRGVVKRQADQAAS